MKRQWIMWSSHVAYWVSAQLVRRGIRSRAAHGLLCYRLDERGSRWILG